MSLWSKLGIACAFFRVAADARSRGGGFKESLGQQAGFCAFACWRWHGRSSRNADRSCTSLGSRLTRGWACARRFGCAHVRHA